MCLAFGLQWLFNDSIVGTSVIFWVLLGISVFLETTEPDQEKSCTVEIGQEAIQ